MIGAEIRNQLLHPHVGNLAKQRIGRVHPASAALLRDVGVARNRLELNRHVALCEREEVETATGDDMLAKERCLKY